MWFKAVPFVSPFAILLPIGPVVCSARGALPPQGPRRFVKPDVPRFRISSAGIPGERLRSFSERSFSNGSRFGSHSFISKAMQKGWVAKLSESPVHAMTLCGTVSRPLHPNPPPRRPVCVDGVSRGEGPKEGPIYCILCHGVFVRVLILLLLFISPSPLAGCKWRPSGCDITPRLSWVKWCPQFSGEVTVFLLALYYN